MEKILKLSCPFCKHEIETTESWARKNGRLFCPTCCKSFDVDIKEEEEDEIPDIPYFSDDGW